MNSDKTIVDDPDSALLPYGCIDPDALRALADMMVKLRTWHAMMMGAKLDAPCLRRVESVGDRIIAYVHVGPSIGGFVERLICIGGSWRMQTEDLR